MITQPENNIKLEDSQIKAIEEVKTRLINLESEISIVTKNLKATKTENDRLVKDNIYQNELLSITESKLSPLQAEIVDLESKITSKKEEISKIDAEFDTKSKEINDREDKVIEKEKEIAIKEQNIKDESSVLEIAKTEIENKIVGFNSKVAKLKEVLPTL